MSSKEGQTNRSNLSSVLKPDNPGKVKESACPQATLLHASEAYLHCAVLVRIESWEILMAQL